MREILASRRFSFLLPLFCFLPNQITEEQLKGFLEQVNERMAKKTKIRVSDCTAFDLSVYVSASCASHSLFSVSLSLCVLHEEMKKRGGGTGGCLKTAKTCVWVVGMSEEVRRSRLCRSLHASSASGCTLMDTEILCCVSCNVIRGTKEIDRLNWCSKRDEAGRRPIELVQRER